MPIDLVYHAAANDRQHVVLCSGSLERVATWLRAQPDPAEFVVWMNSVGYSRELQPGERSRLNDLLAD